jgi:hypothetical protein
MRSKEQELASSPRHDLTKLLLSRITEDWHIENKRMKLIFARPTRSGRATRPVSRLQKVGQISSTPGKVALNHFQGNPMSSAGKKNEPPEKTDDKSKKPPPPPVQDDDVEDGDIATPKRDRYGNDDEPL